MGKEVQINEEITVRIELLRKRKKKYKKNHHQQEKKRYRPASINKSSYKVGPSQLLIYSLFFGYFYTH